MDAKVPFSGPNATISETNEESDYFIGFNLSSEGVYILDFDQVHEKDASNDKSNQICDVLSSKTYKKMFYDSVEKLGDTKVYVHTFILMSRPLTELMSS